MEAGRRTTASLTDTWVGRALDASGEVPPGRGHRHTVQFYESETYLASVVGEFLAAGAAEHQPLIVVATPEHRRAFATRLRELGVDVRALRRTNQLQLLDARDLLTKVMRGPEPDPARFHAVVGNLIARALGGRTVMVRAYGEMVDLLWKDGNTEGALRLERLWNELADEYAFSLLCAYAMGNFCRANDAAAFQRVCAEHSHVTPTESYLEVDDAARLREIARLQQRARALEIEVAEREAVERRLRESIAALSGREADLRDVLENAAEGIHLVGPDGTIEWANPAELAMLGYAAEEYIGRNIVEFHADGVAIENILERLSAGDTLHNAEARLRHKDGSIRHVLVNSNVRWRDGRFMHTRCFTKDISAIREAADAREAALAAERVARVEAEAAHREADEARAAAEHARAIAEQANRAKSDFLAVMSHELRTPLNAIGGYAELMELGIHGPLTVQQRDALGRIQRSQRMLLGLINQVLNYARVETGNVRYDVTAVPLAEALRSAEALIAPHLRAKGLHFELSTLSDDVSVHADAEKLQQILINLLINAVKFTDRGGLVRVSAAVSDESVQVRIVDTGIGIAAEKLGSIFEPFVQVDSNYTRTRDGVGLGLAISRDLARGMRGELGVTSVVGAGSTFTLTLPRAGDGGG